MEPSVRLKSSYSWRLEFGKTIAHHHHQQEQLEKREMAKCSHGARDGLQLSRAKRQLVAKSMVVHQMQQESAEFRQVLEDNARQHVQQGRQRVQQQQQQQHQAKEAAAVAQASENDPKALVACNQSKFKDRKARDHALILRHVGAQLARVAMDPKRHPHPHKPLRDGSKTKHTNESVTNQSTSLEPLAQASGVASKFPWLEDPEEEQDRNRRHNVLVASRRHGSNVWTKIFAHEQAQLAQEQLAQLQQKHQLEQTLCAQYATQQQAKHLQKLKELTQEQTFFQHQQEDLHRFQQEQAQHQQQVLAQKHQLADLCAQEVQKRMQKLRQQKHKQILQEQELLQLYQTQLDHEKHTKIQAILHQKAQHELMNQQNAHQMALKKNQLQRQQEQDLEMQKAYARKMQQQEERRQQELELILQKQQQKFHAANEFEKKKQQELMAQDAKNAQIQLQRNQQQEREAQQRLQRQQEATRLQLQQLQLQIATRQTQQQLEKQRDLEQAQRLQKQLQQETQLDQQHDKQIRQKNKQYQSLIKQQMHEDAYRRQNEDKEGMSRQEMALNKQLLQQVGIAPLFPLPLPKNTK